MKKNTLLFYLMTFIPFTALQAESADASKVQTTVVAKGENLLDVAKRCQTTTENLIQLNRLQKPFQIYIGQPLKYQKKLVQDTVASKSPINPIEDEDEFPQTFNEGLVSDEIPQKQEKRAQVLKNAGYHFAWPVKGKILSGYGKKKMGHKNDGVNIGVKFQTPVTASEEGIVAYAGNEIRGFGNMILLKHGPEWSSAYAHNDILLVSKGDIVKKGQIIAKAGNTGHVDSPQVHFELRHKSKPVDPAKHLK